MEKILVIQTAFLGDALLTLPMIEKLKEKYPSSEVDVLCIPATRELFSASPFITGVIVIDKKKAHKSIFQLYKFSREIKERGYKKIFSPHRSLRTALIVMQSGVRDTYGFSNSAFYHLYKNVIEYNQNIHEVQRNLDLIGWKYSSDNWRIVPKLKINETARQRVADFLLANNVQKRLIAIAPGSVWETKKYPEVFYKEIIGYFLEKSYQIIIVGGELDKELGESLSADYQKNVFSVAGYFSINESVEILRKSKLLLTNDSAPTHLGMCAETSVLTIYCSTIPEFGFYPYNAKSSYISFNDLNCKPCGIHGFRKCPISTFDCGYKLDSKIIISKMEELLND